ncbi:hypothetical protein [Woodsholea maritima]|uniref:hypothetical protein n=1 Tax=Woodsholea maritima TaxID=240237 RepID=UPI00036ED32E|nr:hypothetical protein [Woodsholea maritima]
MSLISFSALSTFALKPSQPFLTLPHQSLLPERLSLPANFLLPRALTTGLYLGLLTGELTVRHLLTLLHRLLSAQLNLLLHLSLTLAHHLLLARAGLSHLRLLPLHGRLLLPHLCLAGLLLLSGLRLSLRLLPCIEAAATTASIALCLHRKIYD